MVRWAASEFHRAELFFGHGTNNAWEEAQALLMHILNLPYQWIADTQCKVLDARLTEQERCDVAQMVWQRVSERVPLPYITHQAWFCGLPFYVDERVLIPRSPIAELINNGFSDYLEETPARIMDLCTGGACIAIALAYQFTDAQVDALDISSDALDVAEINISQHGLSERVVPIQSDLFSAVDGQRYDLIVSNPPYVDAEDMADLPDEFTHEPELALAAGDDGLDLVETILRQAPAHLTDHGWLFVEVGNSMVHFAQRFPGLNVTWVNFTHGGDGVFAVDHKTLSDYFS